MTTILMLFIFPIGVAIYLFDKKTQKINHATFDAYTSKIFQSNLSDREKLDKVDELYYQNGYSVVEKDSTSLTVEKKHFNLGVLFMLLGLASYFGIAIYWIYYRFFMKPEQVEIDLNDAKYQ